MAKIWVTLGAAVAIAAATFTHSNPAVAQQWVAPAASQCHGAYYGGGNCCGNEPRGLFTSGFFGGCGCGSWQHPATTYEPHGPAPYYTGDYVHPYYRHPYRSYLRHHVYHGHSAYRGHGVYRAHYNNAHVRHW